MELADEEIESDVTAGSSFTLHSNFKIFARAVLALNRVGNELYMEPSDFGLILRSLNCSKSAFGTFMFSKAFFSECEVLRLDPSTYNVCRIPMKCALSAFKCVKNAEKVVLSCQLFLNSQADTMLVQLTHTYDVIRSHQIPFFECTTMFRTVVDRANLNNYFVIQARLLLEMFNRMHHNTDEISIDAKIEEISFRNYIMHEQDKDMVMKTEGKIPVAEFQKYSVQRPAEITVNLKELKAIVNFADVHQSPVSIYFDQPGTPILIALEGDVNYTAEVILATAVDDSAGYDVNLEVPVEVVGVSASEGQLKRKRSQSSFNISENIVGDCTIAGKRIIDESIVRTNAAENALHGVGDMDFVIGPPNATSSPIRKVRLEKIVGVDKLVENLKLHDSPMDTGNKVTEISREKTCVDGIRRCGSESPPSRGSALFRYLFAIDEQTFDSADFSRDTEILASDSGSETSDLRPEQYICDSDPERNSS